MKANLNLAIFLAQQCSVYKTLSALHSTVNAHLNLSETGR